MKKWISKLKNKFSKTSQEEVPLHDESEVSELEHEKELEQEASPSSPNFLQRIKQKFKKKKAAEIELPEDVEEVEEEFHGNEEQMPPDLVAPTSFFQKIKKQVQNFDATQTFTKFKNLLNKEKLSHTGKDTLQVGNKFKQTLGSVDWMKLPDKLFSARTRTHIHSAFLATTFIITSYGVGKTLAIFTKGEDKSIERTQTVSAPLMTKALTVSDFKKIGAVNVFRTDEKKKDADGEKARKKINRNTKCIAATKKTNLPLTLINTVVLQDEVKSIAAVQVRSKKEPMSVRVGETIGKYAKVDKITRLEVILKNLKDGSCELLASKDLIDKKDNPITVLSPRESKSFVRNQPPKGISNNGNNFKISKKFLKTKMKDLSSILTQARAIRLTNPDGSMAFKVTDIVPDSVFANLGVQDNDIITSINGEKITDMNQVMGLLGKLENLDNLSMDVQRNGRKVPLEYSFSE